MNDQDIREDRLEMELLHMEELRQESSFIDFAANAAPPDEYTVTFACLGMISPNQVGDKHIARIYLHSEFPRLPPKVSFLTPSFHPNIAALHQMPSFQQKLQDALRRAPNEETRQRILQEVANNKELHTVQVCLDTLDHNWSTSITVAQICVELAEMIQYKRFNPGDPLNVEAARWSILNRDRLPVDVRTVLDLKALAGIRILTDNRDSGLDIRILEADGHA